MGDGNCVWMLGFGTGNSGGPRGALQIPPLRSPGFPVDLGGVGALHAPFPYGKTHTPPCPVRCSRKSGYAAVGRTKGRVLFSGKGGEWLKETALGFGLDENSVWWRDLRFVFAREKFKGHLQMQEALESWQAASCSRWLSRSSCIGNSYRCVP
jgi:hypothetical protein